MVLQPLLKQGAGPLPGVRDARSGAFFKPYGKRLVDPLLEHSIEFRLGPTLVLGVGLPEQYAHPL